jgi:uncharacterized membrane-anchored protein
MLQEFIEAMQEKMESTTDEKEIQLLGKFVDKLKEELEEKIKYANARFLSDTDFNEKQIRDLLTKMKDAIKQINKALDEYYAVAQSFCSDDLKH